MSDDKSLQVFFRIQKEKPEDVQRYMFHCPGCGYGHVFDEKRWHFNNDLVKPTITPSYLTGQDNFTKMRCHSFIKDGKIQFLDDCFHSLRGQTVDLPTRERE